MQMIMRNAVDKRDWDGSSSRDYTNKFYSTRTILRRQKGEGERGIWGMGVEVYQDNRVQEDSKKREKVYQGVSGGNGGVLQL